jgi:hypothetical protein
MERLIIKGLLLGVIVISSCYYDVEEILYPPTSCVTENMSYQANIVPILERNCYACHSTVDGPNNGNIIVEGYTELIKYVDSGQLSGAINHQSGYSAMPKDAPKLSSCDISKIDQWILDGAPNN